MRSETKQRLRALREGLPEAEQTLLILRVDRGLGWREIAQIMAGPDAGREDELLERAAARMRKQFQQVKAKLRALAQAEGLL